jgi:murein DD-endopeptidase MepM/ murein hydrolase activator NlpD
MKWSHFFKPGGALTIASVPLFGMMTAFAFAPGSINRAMIETLEEPIVLPMQEEQELPLVFWHETEIVFGDTIPKVIERLDITEQDKKALLKDAVVLQALRDFKAGETLQVRVDQKQNLLLLDYFNDQGEFLRVQRKGNDLIAEVKKVPVEKRIVRRSATITSSFFAATDSSGIPYETALDMTKLFESDIDFHKDLREGDHFSLIYEEDYFEGRPFRIGKILAAEFINDGKTYQAFLYRGKDGKTAYYDANGKSNRKGFLRAPLEFSRITSGFSLRFHPILKKWRAHKGVDYGAPSGTRVRAVGDGTISFAGVMNGYGNIVEITHRTGLATRYAHLRGFASGIRKGAHVSQGQIIGYVGQTGWATGPHLHYEVRVNGNAVNPLSVKLPSYTTLEGDSLATFKANAEKWRTELAILRANKFAALD